MRPASEFTTRRRAQERDRDLRRLMSILSFLLVGGCLTLFGAFGTWELMNGRWHGRGSVKASLLPLFLGLPCIYLGLRDAFQLLRHGRRPAGRHTRSLF